MGSCLECTLTLTICYVFLCCLEEIMRRKVGVVYKEPPSGEPVVSQPQAHNQNPTLCENCSCRIPRELNRPHVNSITQHVPPPIHTLDPPPPYSPPSIPYPAQNSAQVQQNNANYGRH